MFPSEMLACFNIVKVSKLYKDEGVGIELEECTGVPVEFEDRENDICHGSHDWQFIHDPSFCGDIFNLRIHHRKWITKKRIRFFPATANSSLKVLPFRKSLQIVQKNYIDTTPISISHLVPDYSLDGERLEKQYKYHLSDFNAFTCQRVYCLSGI